MKKHYKKSLLLLTMLTLSNTYLLCQDRVFYQNGVKREIYYDRSQACNKDKVFTVASQMPKYKGDLEKLEIDLNNAITIDRKIKDQFFIRLTVNCNNKAFGFLDIYGENPEIAQQIIEQLIQLQNWEAGTQRGANIDCFVGFKVKLKKGRIILR